MGAKKAKTEETAANKNENNESISLMLDHEELKEVKPR
jgi:hypothetical protein